MNRTPEAKAAPGWFTDPLADQFFQDEIRYGRRRVYKSGQVEQIVARVRRRQFNAERDTLRMKREGELARYAEAAVDELGIVSPEVAEALIRMLARDVLGGRVLVPSETRKINKKDTHG